MVQQEDSLVQGLSDAAGGVMGRDARRWEVVGSVSRHNSPQDIEDDRLWSEMVKRLEEIVNEYVNDENPRLIDWCY